MINGSAAARRRTKLSREEQRMRGQRGTRARISVREMEDDGQHFTGT